MKRISISLTRRDENEVNVKKDECLTQRHGLYSDSNIERLETEDDLAGCVRMEGGIVGGFIEAAWLLLHARQGLDLTMAFDHCSWSGLAALLESQASSEERQGDRAC